MVINKKQNMKARIKNNVVFFFWILLASCSSNSQVENDTDLINKIFSAVKAHNTQDVSLKTVTNFKWDKVCIFPPYTPIDSINAALGFNWELSGKTNIQHDDVSCLIVFAEGRTVVKYLLYPRNKGDFSALVERCYSQERAVYKVQERNNDGKIFYVIRNN